MNHFIHKMLSVRVGLLLIAASLSFATNPIITHIYTADPSAHVWGDGKVWLYPSHDQDRGGYSSMDGHHVFSSSDLVTWTDHGEIMHTDDISWAGPGWLWAPDAAYKNGTYYYYYPAKTADSNEWRIGVATSSTPAGPFADQGYIEGTDEIDPAVFVDDDGQAYLYWGGHQLKYCLLGEDMMSCDGEVNEVDAPNYYEGPWVHKADGIYYLSYATGGYKPLDYCTSNSPRGPWIYQGILMEADVTGGATNHHSIVEFNDQWYIFYHGITLSGDSHKRSVNMDSLFHNPDGTIRKVIQTDGNGNSLEEEDITSNLINIFSTSFKSSFNSTSKKLIIDVLDWNGSENYSYSILNALGKVLQSGNINKKTSEISVSGLEAGVYFVRVNDIMLNPINLTK